MIPELNADIMNLISIFLGAVFAMAGSVMLYFKVKGDKDKHFSDMKYDEVITLIGCGVILLSFIMGYEFGIITAIVIGLAVLFENKPEKA